MWTCPNCNRSFKNISQNHYCGKVESVDEYITSQPAEIQSLLQQLRETIRAAAPEATKKIMWNVPYFTQGKNIVGFAAQKKHISFFPGATLDSELSERFDACTIGEKGTIRLPYDTPIDHALIADIVRWRVAQITGNSMKEG